MIYTGDLPRSLSVMVYFRLLADHLLTEAIRTHPDMTRNQVELIMMLGRELTMKEVAEALLMHPSNVTGLVKDCDKVGWMERVPSKTDKRTKHLVLTSAGVELRRSLIANLEQTILQDSELNDDVASQILSLLGVTDQTAISIKTDACD